MRKDNIQLARYFPSKAITNAFCIFGLFLCLASPSLSHAQENIPGIIEAENYTAYNNAQVAEMLVPAPTTDGGEKVGYNDPGDWYEYQVNVAAAGNYDFDFRVSNGSTTVGQLQLSSNGTTIATVDIPGTGGWEVFQNVAVEADLSAGMQTLRITVLEPGVDINWIEVTEVDNSVFDINFVLPTVSTFTEGDNVAVELFPPDGEEINVALTLNGQALATEESAPYQWGTTRDTLLRDMAIGEYTLIASATLDGDSSVTGTATYSFTVVDGNTPPADVIVRNMGPGFNVGNVFDNGIQTATFASVKPIIDLYVEEGMTHTRIPTTWIGSVDGSTLADANGNLNTDNPRFAELVATIDYALEKGLYVMLNTHHEHWLKDNYDGSASFDNRFSNLWTNIATYFKEYPSSLIFEVLNEPEGAMGQWGAPGFPNPLDAQAIGYTRQIMQVGYDAIRATGGPNTTRVVMVSTNGQGNDSQLDDVYPNASFLPAGGNDDYLAVQVHTYDPWEFCGQNGSNANFAGLQRIVNDLTTTAQHASILGVPVNYGEYGVGRDGNQAERNTDLVRSYYTTLMVTAINNNMSATVWDDRGWFGLVNGSGTAFIYNIVPTILGAIEPSQPTSVRDQSFEAGITVYPVPVNDVLTVGSTSQFSSLQLINSVGQVVQSVKANSVLSMQLNVSGIPSGIYTVHVIGMNGLKASKKVVINN